MSKTTEAYLKALWLRAAKDAHDFISGHTEPWTPSLDSEYLELRDHANHLYYEWMAVKTGRKAQDVASAVTESVHSRYD
jgi:hypothetical protein